MNFEIYCPVVEVFPQIGSLNEQQSGSVVDVIEMAKNVPGGDGRVYEICKIEYSDESYQLMAIEM
jgi:hypothetical protein